MHWEGVEPSYFKSLGGGGGGGGGGRVLAYLHSYFYRPEGCSEPLTPPIHHCNWQDCGSIKRSYGVCIIPQSCSCY